MKWWWLQDLKLVMVELKTICLYITGCSFKNFRNTLLLRYLHTSQMNLLSMEGSVAYYTFWVILFQILAQGQRFREAINSISPTSLLNWYYIEIEKSRPELNFKLKYKTEKIPQALCPTCLSFCQITDLFYRLVLLLKFGTTSAIAWKE